MVDHLARTQKPHTTIFCFRHGGTHLVKPLVKRLVKLPTVDPDKLPVGTEHVPLGPVVVAFRNPRNIMVAHVKWDLRRRGEPYAPSLEHDAAIAKIIRKRLERMLPLAEHWSRQEAVHLRFETLVDPLLGPIDALRIARELGQPAVEGAAALCAVLGTGHTFTGSYSNWTDWFGPKAAAAWREMGGDKLAAAMGYD